MKLELRVKGLENDSILAAFKEVQRKQAVEAVEKWTQRVEEEEWQR